jgi:hypothetical protein
MAPSAHPQPDWDRLLAVSQRWFVKLAVSVVGIVALFRLIPNRPLLTVADVVFLVGCVGTVAGKVISQAPQLNSVFDTWPDTRWARWAKPPCQFALLAAMGPLTLATLCVPFILLYPGLLNTPFKTIAEALLLLGGIPALLVMALVVLVMLLAFAIALPIGIFRATAHARRRRHYDYPPHLPRRRR